MSSAPPAAGPAEPDAWTLIVRTIALLAGLAILVVFVALVWEMLVLILIAGVLAAGMRPAVQRAQRVALPPGGWHPPAVLVILLLYLAVAAAFGGLAVVLFPALAAEVREFATDLPQYVAQAQAALAELSAQQPWLPGLELDARTLLGQLAAPLQAGLPGVFRFAAGVVETAFSLVLVLTIALYIQLEGARIRRFALRLLPAARRAPASLVVDEILTKTGLWLLGQIALGFIIFLATAAGLLVLGVPYALLLALIAGALEIVPMLGPILSAIIAVTVTLFVSPLLALKVLVLFVLIQQLENNLLVPRVMSQTVGISPLTVLLALVLGGKLLGLVGALLAVPVAAALQVLVYALLAEEQTPPAEAIAKDGVAAARTGGDAQPAA